MRAADDFPLAVGDRAERSRVFGGEDIAGYRDLAQDTGLRFGGDGGGVPGPLLAGMISDLLGTTLPGLGTMWMKQSLEYVGEAPVGSEVTAHVEITRLAPEKSLVYLDSGCTVGGDAVVIGKTLVMVPNLSERA